MSQENIRITSIIKIITLQKMLILLLLFVCIYRNQTIFYFTQRNTFTIRNVFAQKGDF